LVERVANRRANKERNRRYFNLDPSALTNAMLGVLFSVLISVMISGYPHHGLAVDRPMMRHLIPMPASLREDAMRIMITRDGKIYFGNARLNLDDLSPQIRDHVRKGAQHKVYLIVDSRARYADLEAILDEVRHAGIKEVAFLAESPVLHK
jgi:biopolymer transport protein ExbD